MRDKSRAKVNITLRIAAVMLVLVLISASMISGMYARFTTTAYGEDSARVAKWDVDVTNTSTTMNFNESGTQIVAEKRDYTFTVTNNSEVSMEFFVKVSFDKKAPAHITLKLDNGEEIECNGEESYTFTVSTPLTVGEEKTHSLSVIINYIKDDKLVDFPNFPNTAEISVIAEQVD